MLRKSGRGHSDPWEGCLSSCRDEAALFLVGGIIWTAGIHSLTLVAASYRTVATTSGLADDDADDPRNWTNHLSHLAEHVKAPWSVYTRCTCPGLSHNPRRRTKETGPEGYDASGQRRYLTRIRSDEITC